MEGRLGSFCASVQKKTKALVCPASSESCETLASHAYTGQEIAMFPAPTFLTASPNHANLAQIIRVDQFEGPLEGKEFDTPPQETIENWQTWIDFG